MKVIRVEVACVGEQLVWVARSVDYQRLMDGIKDFAGFPINSI